MEIQDEFTNTNLTKFQKLYYRRKRDGICVCCGKGKTEGKTVHCKDCRIEKSKTFAYENVGTRV